MDLCLVKGQFEVSLLDSFRKRASSTASQHPRPQTRFQQDCNNKRRGKSLRSRSRQRILGIRPRPCSGSSWALRRRHLGDDLARQRLRPLKIEGRIWTRRTLLCNVVYSRRHFDEIKIRPPTTSPPSRRHAPTEPPIETRTTSWPPASSRLRFRPETLEPSNSRLNVAPGSPGRLRRLGRRSGRTSCA